MLTVSVDEAYFLVRVGSWTQADLSRWLLAHIDLAMAAQEERIRYEIKEEDRLNQYNYDYTRFRG